MYKDSLVSIIIPCYNVGEYIEKCIRSICAQSYRNLQIIAVNDGSKDDTLEKLQHLSKNDERVEIIDKKNEGVSTARNDGINAAQGNYVIFVDGDDYLAPDYVEYMLGLASMSGSDMAISKNCYTRDNEEQVEKDCMDVLDNVEATALLLSPRVIVGCWNKMFKKSFLDKFQLRFLTDLYYGEGLYFITKSAQLANNIAVGERKVYYYRRNNEASATSKFKIEKYHNGEKSLKRIHSELVVEDKRVETMMSLHLSLFCLGALSQAYAHHVEKEYCSDCKHWRQILGNNLGKLLISSQVSVYRKLLLTAGFISPRLISKLDMRRRQRIAQKSVN